MSGFHQDNIFNGSVSCGCQWDPVAALSARALKAPEGSCVWARRIGCSAAACVRASVCISYLLLIQHQFISFITLSTMLGGGCSSDKFIKPKLSRVKIKDSGGEVSCCTDKISQYNMCLYNSRHLTELQSTANSKPRISRRFRLCRRTQPCATAFGAGESTATSNVPSKAIPPPATTTPPKIGPQTLAPAFNTVSILPPQDTEATLGLSEYLR